MYLIGLGLELTSTNTYVSLLLVSLESMMEGQCASFFYLLIGAIATNNSLFCGREDCCVPTPNQAELEKRTYQYVGQMIAVSIVHGGPSPAFFAPSLVDYIFHGMRKVKATAIEVPSPDIRNKLEMVGLIMTVISNS